MNRSKYKIFCDESGHLGRDRVTHMVLGALWCPAGKVNETRSELRGLKARHGLSPHCELKWGSISPSKIDYYRDVLDFWWSADFLNFRALVADKNQLQHREFDQDHDEWYHKMYFALLGQIFEEDSSYEIYVDIKDTRSASRIAKLHDVLCNKVYDFDRAIVTRVQTVRSHEVEEVQLADFLTGVVGAANRGTTTSSAKLSLVDALRKKSGCELTRSTPLDAKKKNSISSFGRAEVPDREDSPPGWLPARVANDFPEFRMFEESVYEIFCRDLLQNQVHCKGKRVSVRKYPVEDGREFTYWHLVTEGKIEAERQISLSRLSHLCWIRPIIENASDSSRVVCWQESRKGRPRVLLCPTDFRYMVVLEIRSDHLLLITSYPIDQENRRRKVAKDAARGATF